MASQAQILANLANALKSTGPKSADGKARVAKNATSHGLATGVLVIPAADRAAFCEFEANLAAAIRPKGAMEAESCRQLARSAWNLRRLRQLIHELAAACDADPFSQPEAAAQLRQLTRYRATLEMNFYRGLKTLRDLQTRRAARELQLHEPEKTLYPPHVEPRFYAKLPNTHGDRALVLEARGYIGRNVTRRLLMDENFRPYSAPIETAPPPVTVGGA